MEIVGFDGRQHVLIAGAPGCGKSSGPVISTLLSYQDSVLVIDPKTELFESTARYRATLGEAVYFDPTDPFTCRINPLDEVRSIATAQNVAEVLVDASGMGNDSQPFWPLSAKDLITSLVLFCVSDMAPEQRNLGTVYDMFSSLDGVLEGMARSRVRQVRLDAAALARATSQTLNNIESTCKAALKLWKDPLVRAATAVSDFPMSALVGGKYPVSLYLQMRASEAPRLRPLQRLILSVIMQSMLYDVRVCADGVKKLRPLLLAIDEFPAMGKMSDFTSQMRQFRGYGMQAMLVCQSIRDLEDVYGNSQTIMENTHVQLLYASSDPRTLRDVSGALGEREVERVSRSRRSWKPMEGSTSTSVQRVPVMGQGAFRALPYDELLVLVTGFPPFRVKKLGWYEHPVLRARGGGVVGQSPTILGMLRSDRTVQTLEADDVWDPVAWLEGLGLSVRDLGALIFPDVGYETVRRWMARSRRMPSDMVTRVRACSELPEVNNETVAGVLQNAA